MKLALRHLAAATVLVASSSSWAAAVFTSSSAFLAQVEPGAYTETFNSVVDANTNVQSFSGPGGFGYTATLPSGQLFYFGASALSTNQPNVPVTLTFTGTAVTAIGGHFYAIDIGDAFLSAPVSIGLSDGTTETFTPGSAASYRGYTSSVAITSLTFSSGAPGAYATVDNLTIGTAIANQSVPEPGTVALVGLALVGLMATRRRDA